MVSRERSRGWKSQLQPWVTAPWLLSMKRDHHSSDLWLLGYVFVQISVGCQENCSQRLNDLLIGRFLAKDQAQWSVSRPRLEVTAVLAGAPRVDQRVVMVLARW